jgi:DNA-binding response OmpR family regulator
MYRIRGQIADAAEVTTVRGVGYRLTPTVTD